MNQIESQGTVSLTLRKLRFILYIGLIFTVFFISFHAFANEVNWYWIFKWLDIPMHMIGGAVVGYFAVFALLAFKFYKNGSSELRVYTADIASLGILCALIIGIGWEILEHLYGLGGFLPEFRLDTYSDIINDMIGGVIASISLITLLKSREKDLQNKQ